jgi:Domain of unknown function (DUF4124)
MFHVKLFNGSAVIDAGPAGHRKRANRRFWSVLAWLGLAAAHALLPLTVPPALAAIHKCTGADGRIAFSDQPCGAGQTAATVKPAPAAPGSASPKDPDAAARVAARDRIRAAQTPQCVAMGDRISSMVESGARGIPEADVKATVDRYEQQCAAQARVANAAENTRNEARQKQLMVDEECKEKRRILAERRPRLTSLSTEDKKAFAAVESDIARGCR